MDNGINEKPFLPRIPAFEQTLSPARISSLLEKGNILADNGTTALVWYSNDQLTEEEQRRLSEIKGRAVSPEVLIKQAKSPQIEMGIISYNEAVKRDAEVSIMPRVEPFVVATSSPRMDASGRMQMLMERATGVKSFDPEAMSRLSAEEVSRINYQLLMVCEAFHENDIEPSDIGKDFYYRANDNPPRILLYDVSYFEKIPVSGVERAKKVIKNIRRRTELINDFIYKKLSPEVKQEVEQVIVRMREPRWQTFAGIAEEIDRRYNGKFSEEYRQIVKDRLPDAHSLKISQADSETAVSLLKEELKIKDDEKRRNQPITDAFRNLGSEATVAELSAVIGVENFQPVLKFALLAQIEHEVKTGVRDGVKLRKAVLDAHHPTGAVGRFCRLRTKTGEILLDWILKRPELSGLISSIDTPEAQKVIRLADTCTELSSKDFWGEREEVTARVTIRRIEDLINQGVFSREDIEQQLLTSPREKAFLNFLTKNGRKGVDWVLEELEKRGFIEGGKAEVATNQP